MARRRKTQPASNAANDEPEEGTTNNNGSRSVAAHVRDRQRAVAEREAARLARPEQRRKVVLAHADRKKSAVSSTPFGAMLGSSRRQMLDDDDAAGEQGWCGPFSIARQMITEREAAKKQSEEEEKEEATNHPMDEMMKEFEIEKEKKIHPSMTWKGNLPKSEPASLYAKRQKRANVQRGENKVPSLVQLCVDFVVTHFEFVDSLGDVSNDVRVELSKELVARNQLDAPAFHALVEPSLETLEIPDCSGINQQVMVEVLKTLYQLRYILLTHAGRCFGPKVVETLVSTRPGALCCISISGAYLLQDLDAQKLTEINKQSLQSLSLDTCPLLGKESLSAISGLPNLLELLLKDMTFDKETLDAFSHGKEAFNGLQSLTLQSLAGLTDGHIATVLNVCGDSLQTLNLAHNYDLTDECLSSIRLHSTALRSLCLDGVKELTAVGLEALFTPNLEGLPPPPKLKILKLGSCDHHAITDGVLDLVTASAGKDPNGLRAGGLAQLDIQGSSLVSDRMLEHLLETSSSTLTDLNVSYCPLITDQGLGYFVSKTGVQLSKIHVWGCAQLTDEFFDGNARVEDRSLEIVGAWMKRSGTRSLR